MFQRLLFCHHLEDDEKIIYVGRSHVLKFQRKAFKPFFFLIALPLVAHLVFQAPIIYMAPFMAIGAIAIFYCFCDWYADGWVLTDQGILDIKWDGFFHNHCLRLNYDDVSGVTYETNGVIPSMFGFGDVTILIMNGEQNVLNEAARPAKLQKTILSIKNKLATEDDRSELDTFKSAMHKILGDFFEAQKNATAKGASMDGSGVKIGSANDEKNNKR